MARYTTRAKVREAADVAHLSDADIDLAIEIAESAIDQSTQTTWTKVSKTFSFVGDGLSLVYHFIDGVDSIDDVLVDGVSDSDFLDTLKSLGPAIKTSTSFTADVWYEIEVTAGSAASAPADIVQASTVEAQIRARDIDQQGAEYHAMGQITNEFGTVIPLRPGGKYGFSSSPLVNAICDARRVNSSWFR